MGVARAEAAPRWGADGGLALTLQSVPRGWPEGGKRCGIFSQIFLTASCQVAYIGSERLTGLKGRPLTAPAPSLPDRPLRVVDCLGNTMAPEACARRGGRLMAGWVR
jgi:hypothetical protein